MSEVHGELVLEQKKQLLDKWPRLLGEVRDYSLPHHRINESQSLAPFLVPTSLSAFPKLKLDASIKGG